jgi:hypothetical protein
MLNQHTGTYEQLPEGYAQHAVVLIVKQLQVPTRHI